MPTAGFEGLVGPLDALLGADHLGEDGPSEGEENEEGEEKEGESVSTAADEDDSDEMKGIGASHHSAVEGMPLVFSAQQDDTGKGQAVALQISKSCWGWEHAHTNCSLLSRARLLCPGGIDIAPSVAMVGV